MRPFKRLISFEQALAMTLTVTAQTKRTELLPIAEAVGRVSAEDVVSRISVPPFNRSAMDGYAVRARDTFVASRLKPAKLLLGETIQVGSVPRKALAKGACAMIATGAMLPKGADAVVMVEDTEPEGRAVIFHESVHPGQNVSKKGEDVIKGTTVIANGQVLNPSKMGVLAATGRKDIKVYARPLVGVVSTGSELAEPGSALTPGKVHDINSYTLCGAINASGGHARMLGIVGDTIQDIERVVKRNSDCDILVFSGGSSVGEGDVMVDVLERSGKVMFHGIAMKPGKPTLFGTIGRQLVFGMPGHPTSCLSNAYMLLAPVLRKMARLPREQAACVQARMAKRVVSTTGRTQFFTVRLEGEVAYPAFKESGAITSMAFADGYVVIPADVDLLEKDERVTVFLL